MKMVIFYSYVSLPEGSQFVGIKNMAEWDMDGYGIIMVFRMVR